MPTTVQFNRELCRRTIEIQYVTVERMLTAKFVAVAISVAAGGAKGSANYPLPSFARTERDSRKLILVAKDISEKWDYDAPHLNPLPTSGARR